MRISATQQPSAHEFTKRYSQSSHQCDILINTAGIMAKPLLRNSRGYELPFATNQLGYFVLTAGLWAELPQIKRASCYSFFTRV